VTLKERALTEYGPFLKDPAVLKDAEILHKQWENKGKSIENLLEIEFFMGKTHLEMVDYLASHV